MSKLVVGTDLSQNAQVAAQWADRFAEAHDAEIVVCHVTELSVKNWASGAYELLEDEARRRKAEERVEQWYQEAVGEEAAAVDVRVGTTAVQLRECVEENDAEALVVARSGKTSWEQFWLGSTAKALANDPPSNLVIVHPEHSAPEVDRIAVGTDFSANADRALVLGATLAAGLGAELEIVHSSSEPVVEVFEPDEVPEEFRRGDVYLRAQDEMNDLVARHQKQLEGVDYQTHILKQSPAKGLMHFIDANDVDLVVVGRSGQSPFVASVVGSVLNKVVQAADATLVISPAESEEQDS